MHIGYCLLKILLKYPRTFTAVIKSSQATSQNEHSEIKNLIPAEVPESCSWLEAGKTTIQWKSAHHSGVLSSLKWCTIELSWLPKCCILVVLKQRQSPKRGIINVLLIFRNIYEVPPLERKSLKKEAHKRGTTVFAICQLFCVAFSIIMVVCMPR